ncbi:MAG: hypothetical protein LWX56_13770 [Ignavibacteria bacterium]|nr:hypothetical protein [Ignavibacteria bacterium]
MLSYFAVRKNISLHINVSENYNVLADENMISCFLQNLITNAIKFTKEGGWVKLVTEDDNDQIEICIKDNCIGI